jgi:hypothetical protein
MKDLLLNAIRSTGGKFFGVTFTKADGSTRTMNCRIGVQKHANGGTLKYNPADRGNVIVYDVQVGGYRTIKVDRIHSIRFAQKELKLKMT